MAGGHERTTDGPKETVALGDTPRLDGRSQGPLVTTTAL